MSVRSGDRSENETKFLLDALTVVNNMLREEVPGRLRTRACGKGATTAVDKEEAMFDEAEVKGSTKVNEARGTEKIGTVFNDVEDGAVAKVTTRCVE